MSQFVSRLRCCLRTSVHLRENFKKNALITKSSRYSSTHALHDLESFSSRIDARKPFALCRLHSRFLVQLTGTEADDFLQGIITNDVRLLAGSRCEHPTKLSRNADELLPSLYTLCLNVQGRVLFDVIIHRLQTSSDSRLVLEHDAAILASIRNHLRMYKLRRSVNIDEEYGNRMHVWALVQQNQSSSELDKNATHLDLLAQHVAQSLRCASDGSKDNIVIYRDPRPVKQLGYRILIPSHVNVIKSLQSNPTIVDNCDLSTDEIAYRRILYTGGVGEGCQDLLPGKSLPLESNADYLHGVSFEKGCYIGQELTARTFHTGVVRKRLMPILFECPQLNEENSSIKVIVNSSVTSMDEVGGEEKVLGKVRNAAGSSGIALLNIDGALAAKKLEIQLSDGKKYVVNVSRPQWWPKPAESVTAQSSLV